MTIEVQNLLAGVKIADEQGNATLELIEIIARLVDAIRDQEARIQALEP